jgi:hypothetical protein
MALTLAYAIVAVALAIFADQILPIRFGYTVGGAALACLILFSDSLAWQSAITATYAAFAWDLLGHQKLFPDSVIWVWVLGTTAVVALVVARHAKVGGMFLLLTWTAVGHAFRYVLPPVVIGPEVFTMLSAFVLLAIAVTFGCLALLRDRRT